MKISYENLRYLSGESFSNGLRLPISYIENSIIIRMDLIESLVRNRNVIHLGFADHIPLIEKKIHSNTWLHGRLLNCTKRCVGFDIDTESVEYIRNLGYDDVFSLDISKDNIPENLLEVDWDYMVIGEILEHVDNPVSFLKNVRDKFSLYLKKIIITVPNAFRFDNFKSCLHHLEVINSDHRYWFTPYTLSKIALRTNMKIDYFCFCQSNHLPHRKIFKKSLLKLFPAFRDTLLMILLL